MASTVRFDRGTILLQGKAAEIRGAVWDPDVGRHRAPAHLFGAVVAHVEAAGETLEGDLRAGWPAKPRGLESLSLRDYQKDALTRWEAMGRRGIVALPTGAGKTRVATAAIFALGVPALVLVPTRALLAEWARVLSAALEEPIGIVGDGEHQLERVTVMTFESAFRKLDLAGANFGLLIVDEVHHFGSGARVEALEACAAPARIGLSATAPPAGSEAAQLLAELVGPVVIEIPLAELAGTHLAPFDIVRMPVELAPEERERYELLSRPFIDARRLYFRFHRGAAYTDMLRDVARTAQGRTLLRDHGRAVRLACFPRAKRDLVARLLARHRADRSIVFTAHVEDAYTVAEDNLVPVITGEVGPRERARILERFREGRIRAIASARVLNEGIDVPDARVAIVVSGSLGLREHVQRIGRVLRPAPQKRAVVYELITRATVDETSRRFSHAAD